MIVPKNHLEKKVLSSQEFKQCRDYGRVRKGHPEGTVGKHVEHILDYIETHFKSDPDYGSLRLLAMLHDIGKFEGAARPHAKLSRDIAKKFIDDEGFLNLVLLHDKPYHFWTKFKKHGTVDRKLFYEIFNPLNWRLLIKFRYCDNCDRSQEPSHWFENTCKEIFKEN